MRITGKSPLSGFFSKKNAKFAELQSVFNACGICFTDLCIRNSIALAFISSEMTCNWYIENSFVDVDLAQIANTSITCHTTWRNANSLWSGYFNHISSLMPAESVIVLRHHIHYNSLRKQIVTSHTYGN